MSSTSKRKIEQITQLAAEIARHRYELDSISSLIKLEKQYGISKSTLIKYLKEGIENEFGKEKTTDIYKEIWASKIIPKHQEIIRQRGEQLARQFTDRNSESFSDASQIPSLKELKSEFQKIRIDASTSTIQKFLEKGIERVVGKEDVLETSRKMRFRREYPLEYREKVQQIAIKYARQFVDEKSQFFQNQKAIPTQLKIQEELAEQKIKMEIRRIVEQLKEGVLKAVGPAKVENVFKRMWPRHEIALEIQEMVQNKGKELHNKFTDPNSIAYHDCSKLESTKKIWKDLLTKGVKISEAGVIHHLKLGVESQVGQNNSETIWNQMYPRPERKVPIERNLTSETKEKIMEIGADWGRKFNEHASNLLPFLKTVPKLNVIQEDLKQQGFKTSLSSLIRFLKKGIGRETGKFSVKEIYSNLWSKGTPPIVREIIRTEGAFYAAQFCDPKSPYFQDSTHVPTLMAFRKKYRELGFDLTESAIGRNLIQGIGLVPGIISVQELYKKMWPRLDLPVEIQEKVMQIGVACTEQLLASKESGSSKPVVFKSINKIHKELKSEGIILSDKSVAKYLKLGVESRVGTKLGGIYYSEMWPETVPKKLQEKIKEIFLGDVRNLETGKFNQIKTLNFLENELGISKKSIIKYGKIALEKAFGKTKGTELYEKRLSVFEHDELLGKCTHIIWNNVLKNSLTAQGIKYYCEVKLPVPDTKLAQDFVRVDGIAVFAPGRIEQLLNKTGATGKSLYAELHLSPEIVQNAQEIALDPTALLLIQNLQLKNDKYAPDKDGKPFPGRIFLIVSHERGGRKDRVVLLPEFLPNTRLVNMDFVADLFTLNERDRNILVEAIGNSDAHDLTAQEALAKREGFQYATDSDAYWVAKTGHIPDLRYWHDLTDYFPAAKEGERIQRSNPVQEIPQVTDGDKARDDGKIRQLAQNSTRELPRLMNSPDLGKSRPTPEEGKNHSKDIPPNESGEMKTDQVSRNAFKQKPPITSPYPDQRQKVENVILAPPENPPYTDRVEKTLKFGSEKPEAGSEVKNNNLQHELNSPNPQWKKVPEDQPVIKSVPDRLREGEEGRAHETTTTRGGEGTLERQGSMTDWPPPMALTAENWSTYWKIKDGIIWDPSPLNPVPPPEFLEPKQKKTDNEKEKEDFKPLFEPRPEPPDPQDAEILHPPLNLDHILVNESVEKSSDSQGAKNPHPPLNPDPFLENVPIGGEGDHPEDGNPFAEGMGQEIPPASDSPENPFNEPKERQPTGGAGTWDDPFTYPPEGDLSEDGGDHYNPFQEEDGEDPEPPDDTDPFHDHDRPPEEGGQITGDEENAGDVGNDGYDGNDENETEAASDDSPEEDDGDTPDDSTDADTSGDAGDDSGNDGSGDGPDA